MTNANLSKQYFLLKLHHYLNLKNGSIKRKRVSSISSLMEDFIKTVDRLNNSPTESMKKMYTSILKGIIENLAFVIEKNPIFKNVSLITDKTRILKLLREPDRKLENIELRETYNSLLNLKRKLNRLKIVDFHCEVLLTDKNITFGEIDILTDSLLSELMHFGYSTNFLFDWIKNLNVNNPADLDSEIKKICDLSFNNKIYEVLINTWLPTDIKTKEYFDCGVTIKIIPEDKVIELIASNDIFNDFILPKKQQFCFVEISAPDKYRAMERIVEELNTYIGLFEAYEPPPKKIIQENGIIKEQGESWQKISTTVGRHTQEFIRSFDDRFKKDVKRFVKLRSDYSNTTKRAIDIIPIERSLNVLIRSADLNPENRLLNTWSSLEYILSVYPKSSIIEKVRTIIPKTIALYIIKDKLNMLWDEMKNYEHKYDSIKNVITSIDSDGKSFDKVELLIFLSNIYNESLFVDFANEMKTSEVFIYRLICDLNSMTNSPKKYKDAVNLEHESIVHDINSIYRMRNEIAHSDNNSKFDIDITTVRLTFYISSLLGTFIHFQNYHSENTNEGILYSIVETYKSFEDEFKETKKGKDVKQLDTITIIDRLAFPKYLYL